MTYSKQEQQLTVGSLRYLPKRPHVPGHFGTYQNDPRSQVISVLGHPKSSRNGSRMVDMRHRDWEMDRTGPTDHFRPFQTPKPSKNVKKCENRQNRCKKLQKSSKLGFLLASYWPALGAPIGKYPVTPLYGKCKKTAAAG